MINSEPRREARRAYDKRRDEQPWRRWYKTARWQACRAAQLASHPLCAMCEAEGLLVPATAADHVERHQGDEARFWTGKLQSLCRRCHDSDKQRAEAGTPKQRLDADGWPIALRYDP